MTGPARTPTDATPTAASTIAAALSDAALPKLGGAGTLSADDQRVPTALGERSGSSAAMRVHALPQRACDHSDAKRRGAVALPSDFDDDASRLSSMRRVWRERRRVVVEV